MTIDTVVIITKVLPNNQIRILDAAGDPHVITAPPDASLELLRSLAVSRQKVIHLRVINGHVSLVAIDPEVLEDQEGIIAAHREAVAQEDRLAQFEREAARSRFYIENTR